MHHPTHRFDFPGFCRTYGLKPQDIARMAGISPAELASLQKGKIPTGACRRRLWTIFSLFRALEEDITPHVGLWLHAPNAGFDGATPFAVIERGQHLQIWQMILLFMVGEPSDAVCRLFAVPGRRRPLDRFHFQPSV